MAKKGKREIIKLRSSENNGVYYTTIKNKQNTAGKLKRKKYDKKLRKHVVFEEGGKLK